jgi:ABC-type antimicrobial peptide transport system permease subunit
LTTGGDQSERRWIEAKTFALGAQHVEPSKRVSPERQEIKIFFSQMGIRLAVGATPVMLRGTLLWQGLITVAVGAVTGIAGAILTERFLESLVIGARPIGPTAFVLSISCVTAIASASIWIATRRIARLDVMEILRTE